LIDSGNQIRRVVRCHRSQQTSRLSVRSRPDELELVLYVELFEHIGLKLAILTDGFDDLLTLFV
jgi:hypothetical protein